MKPGASKKAGAYLASIRSALPAEVQNCLDAAFAGNAVAARRLMIEAPRRLRGHLAYLAYQAGVKNPAYREILRAAWTPCSRNLLTMFWSSPVLRRMLARADFAIPAFTYPLSVYRVQPQGTPARKATAALCWYLSREAALAAAGDPDGGDCPRILRGAVAQGDVICWSNTAGEQEIVTRRTIAIVLDDQVARFATAK